ncbi:MAG: VWA domain-containing protein [Mycobacterium sp.]|nr:VWA domain-containing protein [Mycobacterium sp.]
MTTDDDAPDVQVHALLASALAGRTVAVRSAPAGEPAWTDGGAVYLDVATNTAFQRRCLAVQASLLAADSLNPAILRTLGRRAALARRYLAIEGHRALACNEELLSRDIRALLDPALAAGTDSAQASLDLAMSRVSLPEPPAAFGILRPRRMATGSTDPGRSGRHLARKGHDKELRELLEDGADDVDLDVLDNFTSPFGGGGAVGKLLQRMMKSVRRRGGGGAPGADSATRRTRSGTRGAAAVLSTTVGPSCDDRPGAAVGTLYPEWDTNQRRYRENWCTVQEVEVAERDVKPAPRPDVHALRRPLTRLGVGLDRCRRQAQGDDIDIDAAVRSRVDTLAGTAGDAAVYIESLRRRRDLAVLVLLDVSGSVNEPGTAGRTVHEQQVLAAHALTVALHELGDRVALYGFQSQGRASVRVLPVKRFEDNVDSAVAQRLAALTPGAYSRLGAAIRHGAAVMADKAGTSRRLLVVVSDGLAYDHGYERAYGAADARRALAEVRQQGTGAVCLTVGAGTEARELRRVFGSAAHAAIPRPERLSDIIGPLFRSALRSADLRRRVA